MVNRLGIKWKQWQILFSWAPKSLKMVIALKIKRPLLLGRKTMTNLDSILKSRDITLPTNVYIVKKRKKKKNIYIVFISHAQMWELDHEEGWAPNNWGFQIAMLEKLLESPLNSKENKPVNPTGNQPWIFTEMTDDEASSNTLVTWCKELIHLTRPWCQERLRAGG